MNASTSPIIAIAQSQIEVAAEMMALAFSSDPSVRYLIENESDRLVTLKHFWQNVLDHDFRYQRIYTCDGLMGVASWLPPDAAIEPFWNYLPLLSGILRRSGWRSGWNSTRKLLAIMTATDSFRHKDCPQPHWYLNGLAVSPQAQGQGVGSQLLRPVLELADRQGEICYLYTSTEGAVRFYQRQGFVVRGELQVLKDSPTLWMMMRSHK